MRKESTAAIAEILFPLDPRDDLLKLKQIFGLQGLEAAYISLGSDPREMYLEATEALVGRALTTATPELYLFRDVHNVEEQECEDLCNGVVPSGGKGSRATTPTDLMPPRTPSSSGGSKAPSSSGASSDYSTPSGRWGGKRQKIGLADALTTIAGQQQAEKDAGFERASRKEKLMLLAQRLMMDGKITAADAGKMLARISTMAPEMVDFFVHKSAVLKQPDPDGDVLSMFCNL